MPTAARRPPRYTDAGIELPRDVDGRCDRFDVFARWSRHLSKSWATISPSRIGALVRQVSSLQLRIEQIQSAIVAGGNDINSDEIIRLSSEHRRLLTTLRAKAVKNRPPG
jgi:hypothetical protein